MAPYLSDPSIATPFKAEYASFITSQQVTKQIALLEGPARDKVLNPDPPAKVDPKELKVGIIGAGCAGLYSALLLQHAGIPFEILESSKRAGGRVMTHYFPHDKSDGPALHNYYDIGAMRFPKVPIMDRTFDLFKRTKVNEKLIPYIMKSDNQPARYNDITVINPKADEFHVSTKNDGPVPYENVLDPQTIMDDAYNRFRNKIKKAVKSGDRDEMTRAWGYLMRHDRFSLRDYLNFVEGQDPETIHWLETIDSATGWFNQAFTENVLESLAFDYYDDGDKKRPSNMDGKGGVPLKDGDWYCVEGGTEELTKVLNEQFASNISFGKRATKMVLQRPLGIPEEDKNEVEVYVQDEEKPRRYSAVINTTTLAALQKMDLTRMEFPYILKAAIRSIHYDTSSKVGIKFKYPWWIEDQKIRGGLGKTDMPLRVCVYPSYNIDDPKNKSAVLLCSYSWGQDSERVAGLIKEHSPQDELDLKQLMIYNLARLHSDNDADFEKMYKKIDGAYITHHAYDWSKDPDACSAFALFSPGDFTLHYPSLVQPAADARLYIVGEAASAHHAWIVGALDSAMRGVCTLLSRFGLDAERAKLEEEFVKPQELDDQTLKALIALGKLRPKEQPKALGAVVAAPAGALVEGLLKGELAVTVKDGAGA